MPRVGPPSEAGGLPSGREAAACGSRGIRVRGKAPAAKLAGPAAFGSPAGRSLLERHFGRGRLVVPAAPAPAPAPAPRQCRLAPVLAPAAFGRPALRAGSGGCGGGPQAAMAGAGGRVRGLRSPTAATRPPHARFY